MLAVQSLLRTAVKVRFTGRGVDKIVEGAIGDNLLHIAEKAGIHIPNACEGSGACGTCQLYINKGMDCIGEITDSENDTLDFAVDVRDNSRLACRAMINTDAGEIEAEIPMQSRNII